MKVITNQFSIEFIDNLITPKWVGIRPFYWFRRDSKGYSRWIDSPIYEKINENIGLKLIQHFFHL